MSNVRELVRFKIEELGLNPRDLSLNTLGKNHAYIHQYLEQGKPKKLPEDVRALLAPVLGVNEAELRDASQPIPKLRKVTKAAVQHGRNLTTSRTLQDSESYPMLKVLGMAEGGPDGWNLFNGEIIQHIRRPDNLIGVPGAYAVYVIGASMEPRFHPGELIHIHPGKPVGPGSYVLVQKKPKADGDQPFAVIKRLVKRSASKIVLAQYSPAREFEIKADEVLSIHRVVGSSEA